MCAFPHSSKNDKFNLLTAKSKEARITTGYGLDDSWVPAGLRILHFSLIIEIGSWGQGAKLTTPLQLVPCQENMDIYIHLDCTGKTLP
jgi:hypothetical protein